MMSHFDLTGTEMVHAYATKVNKRPLVSVCVQTYNHESYIKECLDGILMQKTDFEFEILLGEDDSGDGTRNICIEYAKKYSNKIRLFLHDRSNVIYINDNASGRYNFIYNLTNANGKYIALCEGDDYWTDPLKLQKQVDFLELNINHSMCFHSVDILENNNFYPEIITENRDYASEELLLTKVAHTASYLFHRKFLDINLIQHKSVFGGDLILLLMMAENGRVYGMHTNMGVYRKHSGGITAVNVKKFGVKHYEQFVRQFIFIKKNFKKLPKKAISLKIVDNCMTVILEYKSQKDIRALKYLFIALYYRPELLLKGVQKLIQNNKTN